MDTLLPRFFFLDLINGRSDGIAVKNIIFERIDKRRVKRRSLTRGFLKTLKVLFSWPLGPITTITEYNVAMVMLYTYHFRCVDPVVLIHKSAQLYKILIPTPS